nr:very low-density lipoprotein receptor-like [Lytechinus pictus]
MENPHSIAYDPEDRMVYWADRTSETISRATIDGTFLENILGNLTGLSSGELTLEFQERKIYWATYFDYCRIERANFDGSDRELLTEDTYYPLGIAVDRVNRKLFWKEQYFVKSSDLNGENKIIIAESNGTAASCIFYYQREE